MVGEIEPLHLDLEAARAAGYSDLVAPPMYAVVYSAPAMAPAIFDPEVGIDVAHMVHGAQEFSWGPLVVAGDQPETTVTVTGIEERGSVRFSVLRLREHQSEGANCVRRDVDDHGAGDLMQVGDALPELRVTPDRHLRVRYAGAVGDFNPIHIDAEFARAVGLPGRILHGLYSVALVARATTKAAGGHATLARLRVQFRGVGVPEEAITITATVARVQDSLATVDAVAEHGGAAIVRNAQVEVRLG